MKFLVDANVLSGGEPGTGGNRGQAIFRLRLNVGKALSQHPHSEFVAHSQMGERPRFGAPNARGVAPKRTGPGNTTRDPTLTVRLRTTRGDSRSLESDPTPTA